MKKTVLFFYIGLVFAFIFAIPSLISTRWGKESVLFLINHRIQGTVLLNEWQLNWLGSQHLKGIEIKDTKNRVILQCENCKVEFNILQFLKDSPHFKIHFDGLSGNQPYDNTKDKNHFAIEGLFKGKQLEKLQLHADHFPIKLLDNVLSGINSKYHHFATSLFGNEAKLTLNLDSNVALHMHSPNVQVDLMGKLIEDTFTLDKPAMHFINLNPLLSLYSIDQKIQGNATIRDLTVVLKQKKEHSIFDTDFRIEGELAFENIPLNHFQLSCQCSLDKKGIFSIDNLNFYGYFPNVTLPMHVFFEALDIPIFD